MSFVFVDVEATGPCPAKGVMTEFGAVEYKSRESFHGKMFRSEPDPLNPARSRIVGNGPCPCLMCSGSCSCGKPSHHSNMTVPINRQEVMIKFDNWLKKFSSRPIMVSDNPAFDFQWINDAFWMYVGNNPFGHSARRISDYYAGLVQDWGETQKWKSLRVTPHDHNPVHDALGNVEAFYQLEQGTRP